MLTLEASGLYVYGNFESEAEAIKVANKLNTMRIPINRHNKENKAYYNFEVKSVDEVKKLPFLDFGVFLE